MSSGMMKMDKKHAISLRFESKFLIAQNVIGLMLSVPVLVTAILISRTTGGGGENCATFMQTPIIAVGALLLVVSLAGLFAAVFDKCSHDHVLTWLHLLLMFCLVILLFCFAILSLEITNEGLAHSVTANGQSYKEYRLYEYPKWMRRKVERESYWSQVKACLLRSQPCRSSDLSYPFSNLTYTPLASLTPIQRGCCIPPSACNITYWRAKSEAKEPTKTKDVKVLSTTLHAYTRDCNKWSRVFTELCYDCDTCKAGIIQSSMDKWKKAGILYVVLVIIMIFSYALLACYGFGENQTRDKR